MEKKRSVKGKAAASAVAAVTAAGVLVGGAFADPDDILSNDPDAIVQTMDAGSQIVGIAHADCEKDAEFLADLLRRNHPPKEILTVMYFLHASSYIRS